MRPMQHTIGGVPPATVIHPWPASYRGWGIFVGPLPDGLRDIESEGVPLLPLVGNGHAQKSS